MKNHVNIPIFIPHLGCPNQCVFCNQRAISGQSDFCAEAVEGKIRQALSTVPAGCEREIAFFGGSFFSGSFFFSSFFFLETDLEDVFPR